MNSGKSIFAQLQTARKTAVRIHLNENVFDLIDGEAAIEPAVQSRSQMFQIACGCQGGDHHDVLRPRIQRAIFNCLCVHIKLNLITKDLERSLLNS